MKKARSSEELKDYVDYFGPKGTAGASDRKVRDAVLTLLGPVTLEQEVRFLRNFFAFQMPGLDDGGALHAEVVNRLDEIVADHEDGQPLAFDAQYAAKIFLFSDRRMVQVEYT